MRTTGLVRVTVASPVRRIDVALPERSSVAELLPGLLRYAGEHLADDGVDTGGWVLRRADGSPLPLGQTLASQRVRDGEVLHLVTASTQWPELEYDDVVDAIATGAGRTGRLWAPQHTRSAGIALGAVALALVLTAVLRSAAAGGSAAGWSLVTAVLLLAGGTTLARAFGDASLGAVLGGLALPFACVGGALLLMPDPLTLGTAQLLVAGACLLLASLLGLVGVVDRPAFFVGALFTGVLGIVGGWLASFDSLDGAEAAAVLLGALLAFSPMFGSLSIRLGRVPMPILPRTTADLVRDDPQAPRAAVYSAVVRADAFLTGLLLGTATAGAVCQFLLVRSGRTSALWFVALVSLGYLLRARLYPAVRHRVPVQVVGVAGLAALALGPLLRNDLGQVVPVLLVIAALVIAAGVLTSKRPLSPYLGRYAELLEAVVLLAVTPVCCAVLGLYAVLRGLGG
jgi:type VII secretion integral membrane protein EccD